MPIPVPLIVAGIQAASGVGEGLIQRGQNRRAIERQNEYNSPVNQLARLREAGLPFAAFSDTAAGNQSQAEPQTDNRLDRIGEIIQTAATQKQMELLDAEIHKTKGEGEVAWKEAWIRNNMARRLEDETNEALAISDDDTVIPEGSSNQIRSIKREKQAKALDNLGKALQNDLLKIEKNLKNMSLSEIAARIENIRMNTSLGRQTFFDNDLLKSFDRKLATALREGGENGMSMKETLWMVIRKFLQ